MSKNNAEQRVLDGEVWRDFCDNLKEAGDIILRKETPANPFDRAEGDCGHDVRPSHPYTSSVGLGSSSPFRNEFARA